MSYEERLADIIWETIKLESEANVIREKMDANMQQSARLIAALTADSGEDPKYTMALNLMVHNLKMEGKELLDRATANNNEIKKLIDEAKDLENLLSA